LSTITLDDEVTCSFQATCDGAFGQGDLGIWQAAGVFRRGCPFIPDLLFNARPARGDYSLGSWDGFVSSAPAPGTALASVTVNGTLFTSASGDVFVSFSREEGGLTFQLNEALMQDSNGFSHRVSAFLVCPAEFDN
jgi:hypothetical protein